MDVALNLFESIFLLTPAVLCRSCHCSLFMWSDDFMNVKWLDDGLGGAAQELLFVNLLSHNQRQSLLYTHDNKNTDLDGTSKIVFFGHHTISKTSYCSPDDG